MTGHHSNNTDARQAILDRINTKQVTAPALPDVDVTRVIVFDDPLEKFAEMLAFVGGQAHVVDSASDIKPILDQIDVFRDATRIVSLVPEAISGTVDATQVDDPHELATIDWTIARGEFMVAENGAIWIDGDSLPHRVLLFIAQYLAIVVPKSKIVSNMHQAYEQIEGYQSRFGVFVSGPSKTADIEQSLVLGAHGCRKLQVFIVANA
ncbi:MAG: LUD domain-containing protein [Planctomycetales bacterium]|nr:LUD domain-containing protein [Planctomycetales bacterium]